ncbi:FAD-dependent oxidoreductase [Mycobacterium sp. 236(2023)]|uniref:NAD(P)/FAD-dependent oxidoreductase n=1 Tax=Mycobacterium sp. 236(2023) TaxID=3038163 RepID=UPI00241580B7|nr:FAD-dependent oxidoreductase [Mycobacterium sp. 236(2023)]MDG4668050.1 FAD-dependent oxidoreductase [Mycobacterium sp. 236(2023)]
MAGGVVIIGGGQAGTETALALRAVGYAGTVTVVNAEADPPYRRPPLSKSYLDHEGSIDITLRAPSVYCERGIDLLSSTRAVSIDRGNKRIYLDSGNELEYEWLVLAAGAEPRHLDIDNASAEGIHTLRSVTDARALRNALDDARNAVVLGGGFIGLEVAVSARRRKIAVTVLESGPRLMGRAVSAEVSGYATGFHRSMGTEVRLGDSLVAIEADGGILRGVTTASGIDLPADVLVVGIGVSPTSGLAEHAGLPVDNGIIVDETLRTSDPHIFAVGDCARFPTRFAPDRVRLESVQNATDQAAHVARAIVHTDSTSYDAVPWFWSHQGAMRIQTAGLISGHDRTQVIGSVAEHQFSVLCFRNEILVGVDSVNDIRSHQSARKLLGSGDPLTLAEASADDFDVPNRALGRKAAAVASEQEQ